MKPYIANKERGLTLTELLVVMVIIGLLSTVAVPVYIGRMEDARLRVARAETRELGQAEEQCGLLHGYYVPLQLLDDQPAPLGGVQDRMDQIDLEQQTIFLINTTVPPRIQINNQDTLGTDKPRVRDLIDSWSGPFLSPQRVYVPPGNDPKDPNYQLTDPDARHDFPLDPWGEPYRFYSPIGAIGLNTTDQSINYSQTHFDGRLTREDNRNFERYAIVSYGRDNIPETDATNNDDDIVYLFGSGGLESNFGLRN